MTHWLDSEEADGFVLREQLLNDNWLCTLNIKNVTAHCSIGFLQVVSLVYSRFPDGYFPGWFFSRKDVSPNVVSPDSHFPG